MRSTSPFERYGGFHPEADAALVVHAWREGDTLSGLAHEHYGDWREWRVIADRNGIIDARKLEPGAVLVIPARQPSPGRYESV